MTVIYKINVQILYFRSSFSNSTLKCGFPQKLNQHIKVLSKYTIIGISSQWEEVDYSINGGRIAIFLDNTYKDLHMIPYPKSTPNVLKI